VSDVEAEVEISAPLADVWELYFDPERWRSWVDGFARVSSSDGYPEVGGTLVWESTPPGRGRVSERVIEHEPRRLHRVSFRDPSTEGILEARFEMVAAGEGDRATRVVQALTYDLVDKGPISAITDRLFIRSQMRQSLQRSLADLRGELLSADG
jgi:uncharacterized protein YndB with AHSA1/START domain